MRDKYEDLGMGMGMDMGMGMGMGMDMDMGMDILIVHACEVEDVLFLVLLPMMICSC